MSGKSMTLLDISYKAERFEYYRECIMLIHKNIKMLTVGGGGGQKRSVVQKLNTILLFFYFKL